MPTSIYSLFNGAYYGLEEADYYLQQLKDPNVPACTPAASPPTCTGFPAETGTGALTTAQAQQIAADFTGQTINGTAPSASGWSLELQAADSNYASDSAKIGAAGTSWSELSGLVSNLGSVSSVLNSADSATVSSSGTVVSTTAPMAYNINVNAPAGGYILPSAFSLTFPAGLGVNIGLVADEVNAAANGTSPSAIAAIEANPSGTAIGTVTVTSPVADEFGGSNNQLVGKVYVITTGATGGQGSATQPDIELWLAPGIYDIGTFPSTLTFPLTLSFGEAMTPLGQEPLPFSSLAVSFPATTSPVKATSCTSLGTVGGTATDAVAGLAYEFGDTGDGVNSATGTPAPVTLSASPTAVTDKCVKNTATGSMGGLKTGHPTLRLRIKTGTAFRTVTVGLPRGLHFVKSKRLAKEISASSGKVKSARIAHGKLVITLRKRVKSTTIKARRGAITETAALIKSIKRHRTKKLSVSVHAGSIALRASIRA